jgi:TonB family protein
LTNAPEVCLFQPLELPAASWNRWLVSLALHTGGIAAIILFPVSLRQPGQRPRTPLEVRLFVPKVRKPLVPFRIPAPPRIPAAEPRFVASLLVPPQVIPRRATITPAPATVPEVNLPAMAKLDVSKLDLPALPTSVSLPPKQLPPAPVVIVGGFGDLNGVPASVASTAGALTVAMVGAFELPAGSGNAGTKGAAKGVAVGSFGEASAGVRSGSNSSRDAVRRAGFDESPVAVATPGPKRATAPVETPVEITFKPKPAYTPEAREKRLEGEVQLEVLFSADGQVQVLRLLRGLGSGLDESARSAAAQIRFRPGTRAGNPVDRVGNVHILFKLS